MNAIRAINNALGLDPGAGPQERTRAMREILWPGIGSPARSSRPQGAAWYVARWVKDALLIVLRDIARTSAWLGPDAIVPAPKDPPTKEMEDVLEGVEIILRAGTIRELVLAVPKVHDYLKGEWGDLPIRDFVGQHNARAMVAAQKVLEWAVAPRPDNDTERIAEVQAAMEALYVEGRRTRP